MFKGALAKPGLLMSSPIKGRYGYEASVNEQQVRNVLLYWERRLIKRHHELSVVAHKSNCGYTASSDAVVADVIYAAQLISRYAEYLFHMGLRGQLLHLLLCRQPQFFGGMLRIWAPVCGYKSFYLASSRGDIASM